MHTIEPYYSWRQHYIASEDPRSPFFGREYSEMWYTDQIYNHYIHPQWDNIGSPTLFIKILFADYEEGYAIIEMMGEWNDCIHNDIMFLKRDVIEPLMTEGIKRFILIGENVLNFHESDECYYEEWFDEVEEENGWIAMLNFREHVMESMSVANIDSYFLLGGMLSHVSWRTQNPLQLYDRIVHVVQNRLGEIR
jgi:hypothetical protein